MRLAVLALLAGCGAPAPGDSGAPADTAPPADPAACFFDASCPQVVGVAHRGAGLLAPENTLAAISLGADLGIHGVEVDVRTTADGVLVLMHDDTVDRTTDGTGAVSALTLAEVQALRVTSEVEGIPDQPVPTFLEALETALDRGLVVDVDVKDAAAEALVADLQAAGMADRAFLLTKSVEKGEAYRAADPAVAIMPNVGDPAEIEAYAHLAPELVEVDFLDAAEARAPLEALGARMFTQTLGFEIAWLEAGTAEAQWTTLADDGVGVLQTDRPDVLVPFLEALNTGR